MNLHDYVNKRIRVTSKDGIVMEGDVDHFVGKLDTEDEKYDGLTMIPFEGKLKGRYVNFNENEVQKIEVINEFAAE